MIKDVPYFPFYAANIMSSRSFRLMSLKERGLLIAPSNIGMTYILWPMK